MARGKGRDSKVLKAGGKREHFQLEPLPVAGREWVKLIPEVSAVEHVDCNAKPLKEEMTYPGVKDKLHRPGNTHDFTEQQEHD